jgi:sugar lactone lactonase YvrE
LGAADTAAPYADLREDLAIDSRDAAAEDTDRGDAIAASTDGRDAIAAVTDTRDAIAAVSDTRDAIAAEDAGKDAGGQAEAQPKVPTLALLAGALGGSGTADGIGQDARFRRPSGIASDGAGNLFVTDTENCTIRKIVTATAAVSTIAGSPRNCEYADGTTTARFFAPGAIAWDGVGNLFVLDGCVIRQIVIATGLVTTLAGSPNACVSADGTGAAARFSSGGGLVTDGTGNLFVTDYYAIRKVVIATAQVTTLAGSTTDSGTADGIGKDARFKRPTAMAVDGAGNLFVADQDNYAIRKVIIATGEVTTLAGAPGKPGRADGARDAAGFDSPSGVSYDGAGNLFVTDLSNRLIRKVVIATGQVSTVALGLTYPTSLAHDGTGNLFVTDGSYVISKVVIASGEVTTFAGLSPYTGPAAGSGDTHFGSLAHVTSDGAGNLFIADSNGHAIRKLDVATANVTTLANRNKAYWAPRGLAYDGVGNLLASDGDVIVKIAIAAEEGTILAGSSDASGAQDGTGPDARFFNPNGVAADGAGNVFVADSLACTIRKVVIATGEVTTLAGSPENCGSADGLRTGARFRYPSGVAYDGAGNLFVADTANSTIRKIVIATGEVSTIAGSPGVSAIVDGIGPDVRFGGPMDLACDGKGNLFVIDGGIIRKMVIATKAVSAAVGRLDQQAVVLGPLPASLNSPAGIAVGSAGELFITDAAESAVLVARF